MNIRAIKLKVLEIGYPFAHASKNSVGGAEQVLSSIISTLKNKINFKLLNGQIPKNKKINQEVKNKTYSKIKERLNTILIKEKIDLIHYHGVDFYNYLPETRVPKLVTLHLPKTYYPEELFNYKDIYFNCVSNAQKKTFRKDDLFVIRNGVEKIRAKVKKPKNYVMSLGRICPEKGFHNAILAAKHAQIEWILGGLIYPYKEHQEYFYKTILPLLDTKRRFLGPLKFLQKIKYLTEARALLITSNIEETSSLVSMEAMMCGTPVISFESNTIKEIIKDGTTGFIVKDVNQMADKIKLSQKLNRNKIKQFALNNFCKEKMCKEYLNLFEHLINENKSI